MTTEKSANSLGEKRDQGDELMLSMIRDILLREDRSDIAEFKDQFENNEKLAERINPIIEVHVETLKRKFPREYKKQVDKIIERKLKSSQDELLDLIYPVMGKMVRKYVNHQFLTLKEGIDEKLNNAFSLKGWKDRFKASILGVNESDILLRDLDQTSIEEVYIIERDSGILLAHYSKNETIDRDLIAGMLTAIKSFVEDAFSKERQDLEMIDYGTYKIFIQSFHLYYICIVLDGTVSTAQKDILSEKILDFAAKEMQGITPANITEQNSELLSNSLAIYFDNERKGNKPK